MQYSIEINGRVRHVTITEAGGRMTATVDGRGWDVHLAGGTISFLAPDGTSRGATICPVPGSADVIVCVGPDALTARIQRGRARTQQTATHAGADTQRITAPMPGKIVRVLVARGDSVSARQPLLVVEAMKMENEVRAGRDGIVAELHVAEGALVESGAVLAVVAPAAT